jgi:hypothetical protein
MQIVADGASPRMIHWPAARRLKEQLRGRALRLVAEHLAQIGAVATVLARGDTLDGDGIDALIRMVGMITLHVTLGTPPPMRGLLSGRPLFSFLPLLQKVANDEAA